MDNPSKKNRNCSYYLSQTAIVKTLKPTPTAKSIGSGAGRSRNVQSSIRNKVDKKQLKKSQKGNKRSRIYSSEDTDEEVNSYQI